MDWNLPRWVPIYLMIFENQRISKIFGSLRIFFCFTIHKKLNKSCFLDKLFLFLKKNVSLKKLLLKMNWGLKGGVSIDADSGPLRYVLWCCGSRSQEEFTFIQIGSGHAVQQLWLWEPNYFYRQQFTTVIMFTCHQSKSRASLVIAPAV